MSVEHTQTSAVPSLPRSYKHVNENNAALLLFPTSSSGPSIPSLITTSTLQSASVGEQDTLVLAGTLAEYVGRGLGMVINMSGGGDSVC